MILKFRWQERVVEILSNKFQLILKFRWQERVVEILSNKFLLVIQRSEVTTSCCSCAL
jgi:hypothetical protein